MDCKIKARATSRAPRVLGCARLVVRLDFASMQLAVVSLKGSPSVAAKRAIKPIIESPFTDRLREVMGDHGLRSNYELADLCALRESTVRNIWRGGDVKLSTLERIAESCDVSPTWLIFGVGKKRLSSFK